MIRSKLMLSLAAACVGLLLTASTETAAAHAAGFTDGYDAYRNGEYLKALDDWLPLAQGGDAKAQFNVGVLYSEGRGVDRNMAEAMAWWTKAAKQGHVRAAHNLGLALIAGEPAINGRLREPSYSEAAKWLRMAAEAGYANSLYTLGKMFLDGLGVPEKDPQRAAQFFIQAAEQGFARAQYNLAKLYRDGTGVEKSEEKSLYWFGEAAMRGYAKAQSRMSDRFASSKGSPQDFVEALKWALLASAQGFSPAADQIQSLRLQMSAEQISEAEKRAKEFAPKI